MRFNAANATLCSTMLPMETLQSINQNQNRILVTFIYSLTGEPLQEVAEAEYLDCTLSDDLEIEWTKHIQNATARLQQANILETQPKGLSEIAYFSLVRSSLEYSSTVWSPLQLFNCQKLEAVQRKTA